MREKQHAHEFELPPPNGPTSVGTSWRLRYVRDEALLAEIR